MKETEVKSVDYELLLNQLLKSLNEKSYNNEANFSKEKQPIFSYEFFVFNLFIPQQILKTLINPIIAFRLLDFPTQELSGKVSDKGDHIIYNQGKSSFFEMEIEDLKLLLKDEPLYIMLIDNNFGELKIMGSSRVDISIFAFDNFLDYQEKSKKPLARRNILKLFDNSNTTIAEFDMSLIIRREYLALDNNQNYLRTNLEKNITVEKPLMIEENISKKIEKIVEKEQEYKHQIIPEKENNTKLIHKPQSKETTNVSKSLQNNKPKSNKSQVFLDPSNSKNYISSIKYLIEGSSNPPPLFFHNNKNRYTDSVNIEKNIEVIKYKPEIIIKKEVKTEKNNADFLDSNENRQFITPPQEKPKVIKSVKDVEKKKDKYIKYDEKMKAVVRKQNSIPNKAEVVKKNSKVEEKDNEYMKLYNNDEIVESKQYEKVQRTISESIIIKKDDQTVTNNIKQEKNKITVSQDASYGKEQFYEVSQMNNFTISNNFASNDHFDNSNKLPIKSNKQLKISIEENISISPSLLKENPSNKDFKQSVEDSRNMIEMSSIRENIRHAPEASVEEDYKFDTIGSKEEIEEDFSRKNDSFKKSTSKNKKHSSFKDLIDEDISSERKDIYVICYVCQQNILKSNAIEHADKCKNVTSLDSIKESNIISEILESQNDSSIKESIRK